MPKRSLLSHLGSGSQGSQAAIGMCPWRERAACLGQLEAAHVSALPPQWSLLNSLGSEQPSIHGSAMCPWPVSGASSLSLEHWACGHRALQTQVLGTAPAQERPGLAPTALLAPPPPFPRTASLFHPATVQTTDQVAPRLEPQRTTLHAPPQPRAPLHCFSGVVLPGWGPCSLSRL